MVMGDIAKKYFNAICKKQGGRNAVPSGSTYKLRSSEIVYDGKRVMPSYIMTGGNIQIEKSKVQNDHRGRRGDDRAHRSIEAPPQQAVRESNGLDMHRIAPKLRLRRKLRNHSLPVHAPGEIIHVFE